MRSGRHTNEVFVHRTPSVGIFERITVQNFLEEHQAMLVGVSETFLGFTPHFLPTHFFFQQSETCTVFATITFDVPTQSSGPTNVNTARCVCRIDSKLVTSLSGLIQPTTFTNSFKAFFKPINKLLLCLV